MSYYEEDQARYRYHVSVRGPDGKPTTWVSASYACRILGIGVKTLKRIPPSQLPYLRVNDRGDRKYDTRDLQKWIDDRIVDK